MLTAFSLPSCPAALLDFIALEYRSKCGGHEGAITYAAAELAKGGPMGASALLSFPMHLLLSGCPLRMCLSCCPLRKGEYQPSPRVLVHRGHQVAAELGQVRPRRGPAPGSHQQRRCAGGGWRCSEKTVDRAACHLCPPPPGHAGVICLSLGVMTCMCRLW